MPRYHLVPPDSRVHQEFSRLHRLARQQRPGGTDRWNGELYALEGGALGQLNAGTGAIALSSDKVLPYLAGPAPDGRADRQAQALRTVLELSTSAAVPIAEPTAPNIVRSPHSDALAAGITQVRVVTDFESFANRAGYPNLPPPVPQQGTHAAADSLLSQASGLTTSRDALLSELVATPVGMQFDRLANGVVRNRLREEIPYDAARQEAARARLIEPMLHQAWPALPQHGAAAGHQVGEEIRTGLNSAVEDLRHEHRPSGRSIPIAAGTAEHDELRFLTGQASPLGAVTRKPSLGHGARGRGGSQVESSERAPERG